MLISETIFVLFSLILVFGHGQKVDLSQHKDLILKLHNGYRGIQRSANMKKIVSSNIFFKYNFYTNYEKIPTHIPWRNYAMEQMAEY